MHLLIKCIVEALNEVEVHILVMSRFLVLVHHETLIQHFDDQHIPKDLANNERIIQNIL